MANFSNAKFAINRKAQSTKDIQKVDDLVRFPFLYGNGAGFSINPDADTFGDVVDPVLENSKTQILGATVSGSITVPADADFLALILSAMLGTVNTTNPTAGVYQHVITPSNAATPNFLTALYSDGTCDNRIIGAVPSQIGFGADFQNRRINASVGFAGIRMEDNDGANAGTVTVANATDIWTRTTHGYVDGEAVMLSNSGGALPTGSNNTAVYYVEVLSANTFYLHTTYYGAISDSTADRLNVTTDGTGTHTATKVITSYPAQSALSAFHFTNPSASLAFNIDGAGSVDLTDVWAGFSYSLQDVVAAEQRAGSNTIRAIERVDRQQQLAIMLDYSNATYKDIVRDYQKRTNPPVFDIQMTLKGAIIGATTYNYAMTAHFYNCNLLDHDYVRSQEIGKQTLPFQVNYDTVATKSVDWTIVNGTTSYLT
jgi:hypothetical protein